MGLTILLVDDDQILTEKTKNSLNWDSLGIGMVFTANNIHEAKGILKVYKVDILLCDVVLEDVEEGNFGSDRSLLHRGIEEQFKLI